MRVVTMRSLFLCCALLKETTGLKSSPRISLQGRIVRMRGGSISDAHEVGSDGYVLVTGGAGYIGSHACVELLNSGHKAIIVDSLINSNVESVNRIRELTGVSYRFMPEFITHKKASQSPCPSLPHSIDPIACDSCSVPKNLWYSEKLIFATQ